jgi:RND family efflux transporter, MFP subunit
MQELLVLTRRKGFFVLMVLVMSTVSIIYFLVPPSLRVAHPSRGQVIEAVYATGEIEPDPLIRVATERAARLTQLFADERMSVKAGQALAQLDDAELKTSVQEMQIRQKNAENNLYRITHLFQRKMVSAEQLEQAKTDADAANEVTQRALAQLKSLTLVSPVDGDVIQRDGEIGDYLPVNQIVFYLRKAGTSLRLSASVDEEDIPRVKTGQRVLITADAFPDETFEGIIREITPKGDPITRSYRVRIALPENAPFFIGMTAECNILIAQRDHALLIPNTSIVNHGIWLIKHDETFYQPVTTGEKNADKTEILSGISDQDVVILNPPEKLQAGQKVRAYWPDKTDTRS